MILATNRHAALIFAAGGSVRLGQSKQFLRVLGVPLARRVVDMALATQPERVIVVAGNDSQKNTQSVERFAGGGYP